MGGKNVTLKEQYYLSPPPLAIQEQSAGAGSGDIGGGEGGVGTMPYHAGGTIRLPDLVLGGPAPGAASARAWGSWGSGTAAAWGLWGSLSAG